MLLDHESVIVYPGFFSVSPSHHKLHTFRCRTSKYSVPFFQCVSLLYMRHFPFGRVFSKGKYDRYRVHVMDSFFPRVNDAKRGGEVHAELYRPVEDGPHANDVRLRSPVALRKGTALNVEE